MTSRPANQTTANWRSLVLSFFDTIMSNEGTASANNMEELMALMEGGDEHNKGGNTSGGGCVKDKIEEDEE